MLNWGFRSSFVIERNLVVLMVLSSFLNPRKSANSGELYPLLPSVIIKVLDGTEY